MVYGILLLTVIYYVLMLGLEHNTEILIERRLINFGFIPMYRMTITVFNLLLKFGSLQYI